jgi:hypothetical protein
MTVSAYIVVIDPDLYRTLTTELKAAFPNANEKLDFLKLKKLLYLVSPILPSMVKQLTPSRHEL